MSYLSCNIKNISSEEVSYQGITIFPGLSYLIPDVNRLLWASDDDVIDDIIANKIQINGISSHGDQVSTLKDLDIRVVKTKPFADKTGLNFAGRGVRKTILAGESDYIDCTVEGNAGESFEFTGISLIGCNNNDQALDMQVLMGEKVVNQFAWNWNCCEGVCENILPYNATLPVGLKIRVNYKNNSAVDTLIGMNCHLHKDV